MKRTIFSILVVVVFFSLVPTTYAQEGTGWNLEELMVISNFKGDCEWTQTLLPSYATSGWRSFFPQLFEGLVCTEEHGNTWHFGYFKTKYEQSGFDNMAAATIAISLSSLKFLGSTTGVAGASIISFQESEIAIVANTAIAIRKDDSGNTVGLSYCQVPWGSELNGDRPEVEYIRFTAENQVQWKFYGSEIAYGCTLQ